MKTVKVEGIEIFCKAFGGHRSDDVEVTKEEFFQAISNQNVRSDMWGDGRQLYVLHGTKRVDIAFETKDGRYFLSSSLVQQKQTR